MLSIVPVSDSAKACARLARHFLANSRLQAEIDAVHGPLVDGLVAVHSRCMMHQVSIIVSAVMTMLALSSALFCASVLMQSGRQRRSVLAEVRRQLQADISIVVCADMSQQQERQNELYLEAMLGTLQRVDDETEAMLYTSFVGLDEQHVLGRNARRRAEARARLSRSLAASTFDGGRLVKMVHRCPLGCHESPAAARNEIISDLETAHFGLHIPVPALNRWVKLYGPLVYWYVGTGLGYMPLCFKVLAAHLSRDAEGALDVDALIGRGMRHISYIIYHISYMLYE